MTSSTPAMAKSPKTWFVVADGAGARTYEHRENRRAVPMKGSGGGLEERETLVREWVPVEDMTMAAESAHAYEIGRNAIGMVFESVGSVRHMTEPKSDVTVKVKKDLAKAIAERLAAGLGEGRFERVIIAAPPTMLGFLREALCEPCRKAVVRELAQDLTKLDPKELAARAAEMEI